MWRAVQGNTQLIEPLSCIRGLEMYESAQLNGHVLQARADHVRAVLQEQERQLADSPEEPVLLDWNALAKVVSSRSAWAMRQATRLALKDAMEAQDVWDNNSLDMGTTTTAATTLAPFKRLSMPFNTQGLTTSMTRRLSLPMGSLYNGNSVTGSSRRATVDVHKLKEMNRQFLKSVTGMQGTATAAKQNGSLHSNSLALMLVRGRRLAMHNNNGNNNGSTVQERLADLAQNASLSLGHGLRRDSLHGLIRDSTVDL